MTNHLPEIRNRVVILSTLVLLTVGLISCSDDDPVCPDYQLGAIVGQVTVAGEPVAGVRVMASAYALHGPPQVATTDTTGHFRFDLSNGLYMVTVPQPGSDVITFFLEDTLRVASKVVQMDFALSRAEIRVGLPLELEGRSCYLRLQGPSSDGGSATVKDGLAVFDFTLLKPGAYTMDLNSDNLHIYFPDAILPNDDRDTLQVRPDTPASYEIDFSGSYASLTGRVTGGWMQLGGEKPMVVVFSPDSLALENIYLDPEGYFTYEVLTTEEIVLGLKTWDGLSFFFGGRSCGAATHFNLKPGDRITGVEIPEGRIRLTLNGPGGMINHDASVRVIDDQGGDHQLFSYGGEEPLIIGGLEAGRYFLQVNGYHTGQTWAARWYQGADSLAAATPIDLAKGGSADLTMDLVPGGSISAQVLLEGMTPLGDIDCALFDVQGRPLTGDEYRNWSSFPAGRCEFTGLPNGIFFLAARLDSSDDVVWYPGTRDFSQAEPITITEYAAVTGLTWSIGLSRKGER